MEEISLVKLLLLFVVGIISGFLNILAGGGSFLTLPALMFLGLPATVANGTNRVAILLQNASSIWTFRRAGYFPLGLALLLSGPAIVGAVLGARLAVVIGDEGFTKALGVIMLGVTLLTLWTPRPLTQRLGDIQLNEIKGWRLGALLLAFFFIGIYGGFVQAGIGFLIIASMVLLGMDLIRVNALKLIVIFVLTIPAVLVFFAGGKVIVWIGFILGLGNMLGAHFAAGAAFRKGHDWIKKVVTVTIVLVAVKLMFF